MLLPILQPQRLRDESLAMITRRSSFKRAGLAAAAAGGAAPFTEAGSAQSAATKASAEETFHLGVAGYTFFKFKLEQTLVMLKQLDVHFLCIKDFHLPLKSTDEEIAAFHENCQKSGVTGYGVGPIYMGSAEEVNRAFAYARRVGVKTLVGVPFKMVGQKRVASAELLKLIQEAL